MKIFRMANIPNMICVARVMLVLPIVILLLDAAYIYAFFLIMVAGLSDGLDGFLARRYEWTTRVGGLLDPLADKLLFVSVFATLCWSGLVPVWLFAVVIGRDTVIVAGAIAYEYLIGPVEPRPSRAGKINTMMALLYLTFVITWQIFAWPAQISILIVGAGVFVVSLVSGLDYVLTWSRLALRVRAAV